MSKRVYFTHFFYPYQSEVIFGVFYDEKHKELYVRLRDGTVCGYGGIDLLEYERFSRASSAGRHWNSFIKGNPAYHTLSGDVLFTKADRRVEKAEPAVESNDDTEQAGGKSFTVLVHVEGDLKFDIDAEDLLSATKNVHDLVSKSVVEGAFFVKEVKAN